MKLGELRSYLMDFKKFQRKTLEKSSGLDLKLQLKINSSQLSARTNRVLRGLAPLSFITRVILAISLEHARLRRSIELAKYVG